MQIKPTLGVIGGSGLYDIPGLKEVQEIHVDTPFGDPSAPLVMGLLEGQPVIFLARHGIGHHITPSEVNYRANIYALKSLGVEKILSISAVGSLREDYSPGEIAVPDQLFDLTHGRKRSFFGDGLVAHVSVADPFCAEFSKQIFAATQETGINVHNGGALISIEGPRFSTRAESNVYRSWGMSLIGMTTSPEAFLAREAEMCYGVMAHVTDYDVWHISEAPVSVELVIDVLHRNTKVAQEALRNLIRMEHSQRSCGCGHAMQNSLITRHDLVPEDTKTRLDLLIGKYLGV